MDQLAKAKDKQTVGSESKPTSRLLKGVLQYYLEVFFYNCV